MACDAMQLNDATDTGSNPVSEGAIVSIRLSANDRAPFTLSVVRVVKKVKVKSSMAKHSPEKNLLPLIAGQYIRHLRLDCRPIY